eukprot:768698-Hanusia_phi.AAC.8
MHEEEVHVWCTPRRPRRRLQQTTLALRSLHCSRQPLAPLCQELPRMRGLPSRAATRMSWQATSGPPRPRQPDRVVPRANADAVGTHYLAQGLTHSLFQADQAG